MSAYQRITILPPTARSRGVKPRPGLIDRVVALMQTWRKRARDRTELARMDDLALRDIGADKATIELEVRRAFWQSPLRAWRYRSRTQRH